MKTAIVVDDEIDICNLLAIQLRALGFKVECALTIRDAKKKMLNTLYDVVFIDLNLPDGSGAELVHSLARIRAASKTVVVSAHNIDWPEALNGRVNSFLPKPFSKKMVVETLKELNVLE